MNYILDVITNVFSDTTSYITDIDNKLSAGTYINKYEDGYGDKCLKRCNKSKEVLQHCLSQRIDDVYFWNHKIRKHCKPITSCKYNKDLSVKNKNKDVKITKVESYTGCTERKWLTSKDIDLAVQNISSDNFLYLTQIFWDKWTDIKDGLEKTLKRTKNKNKQYYSWIYNYSSSNGKGTHWVCVFVEKLENIKFEYFDSFGKEPPKNIKQNIEHMMNLFRKAYPDLTMNILNTNKKSFQNNSYDCGLWVIWYIHQRLKGITLSKLQNLDTRDENKRKLYFVCPQKEKRDQKYIYIYNYPCENNISIKEFQRIGIISDGHCGYRTILLHNKLCKINNKELTVNEIEKMDFDVQIDSDEIHRLRKLIYDRYVDKWPGGIPNEIRSPDEPYRLLQRIICNNKNRVSTIEWAIIETIVVIANIFKIEVCCYERIGEYYVKKHMGLKADDVVYQSMIHILNINNLHFELLIKI